MHESLRVYNRVTSLRKKCSEIYYGAKGLLRPKTGLVLPKFHSIQRGIVLEQFYIERKAKEYD